MTAVEALRRLREWLEETHGSPFELRRHFFRRFFDSDLVASPGQWRTVAGGLIAIVASSSIVVMQAYFGKYRALLELDSPEPYRMAMLADHLFFIVLGMFLTALLTCLQWGSLFPALRDYLALAGLPLRARDIFIAKFLALLGFAGIFIVAVNLLPAAMLPAVASGRHQVLGGPSFVTLFVASSFASLLLFFVLVAVQGILLNILPVGLFPRVSLFVQATLLIGLLCAFPLTFAIAGLHGMMNQRPESALALPPVWYLGLDQWMLGNREPYVAELARRAILGLVGAAASAALAYLWSYRRHRIRVVEMPFEPESELAAWRRVRGWLADRFAPNLAGQAVLGFIVKTLWRSQQHRLVLTAFAGIAVALVFNGFVSLMTEGGFRGFEVRTPALRKLAVSIPLSLTLFLLAGYRYLFRLPVELRANWVFRVHEGGNRLRLLEAVERYLIWAGIVPVIALTAVVEVWLLGWWEGISAVIPALLAALILLEILLFKLERIPFTSSYLPGQRPLIETLLLYGVGVAIYISISSTLIASCLTEPPWLTTLCGLMTAGWAYARKARGEAWQLGRLEFEELEEPLVHTLGIERD